MKDVIIERILAGRYAPGERVVESRIAQEFGVSQAPVREAMRDLEAMRFVEYEPYCGSRLRLIAARAGDRHGLLVHDARFPELVVEASGNRTLLDVWTGLRIQARSLVSLLRCEADLGAIAETHTAILVPLRARDPVTTSRQMRRHIESFGAMLAPEVHGADTSTGRAIRRAADRTGAWT